MKQLNWYQIFGNVHTIPDGKTVTPTDDIQTLLHCANIWDKSYTTIGEVIADDDTLFLTLIDNNAIDYLVRSTTFASSIVASESAMQYIGASDYASETLLSDSTWLTAIDGSAYKDYVINASVPTMTSDTTPSGTVTSSGTYSSSYPAYKAFDGDSANSTWQSNKGTSPDTWIQYAFPNEVTIFGFKIFSFEGSSPFRAYKGKMQSSDDNNTFTDRSEVVTVELGTGWNSFACDSFHSSKYWRLQTTQFNFNSGSESRTVLRELQFYGRENAGVQSWLKAGGITNKKYTTVSEVLSDLTTLAALMSSTDAIDYLVTAKGWATEICSDSNAMADIGMNNYAANTLLADETWSKAIADSTYRESVFNVKIPTMTDNTHPYGVASASSEYSGRPAYRAFDGDDSTTWNGSTGTSSGQTLDPAGWIQYQFVSAVSIKCLCVQCPTDSIKFLIEGSNDGVTYETVATITESAAKNVNFIASFVNSGSYTHYRCTLSQKNTTGGMFMMPSVRTMQFYGRKDI